MAIHLIEHDGLETHLQSAVRGIVLIDRQPSRAVTHGDVRCAGAHEQQGIGSFGDGVFTHRDGVDLGAERVAQQTDARDGRTGSIRDRHDAAIGAEGGPIDVHLHTGTIRAAGGWGEAKLFGHFLAGLRTGGEGGDGDDQDQQVVVTHGMSVAGLVRSRGT